MDEAKPAGVMWENAQPVVSGGESVLHASPVAAEAGRTIQPVSRSTLKPPGSRLIMAGDVQDAVALELELGGIGAAVAGKKAKQKKITVEWYPWEVGNSRSKWGGEPDRMPKYHAAEGEYSGVDTVSTCDGDWERLFTKYERLEPLKFVGYKFYDWDKEARIYGHGGSADPKSGVIRITAYQEWKVFEALTRCTTRSRQKLKDGSYEYTDDVTEGIMVWLQSLGIVFLPSSIKMDSGKVYTQKDLTSNGAWAFLSNSNWQDTVRNETMGQGSMTSNVAVKRGMAEDLKNHDKPDKVPHHADWKTGATRKEKFRYGRGRVK